LKKNVFFNHYWKEVTIDETHKNVVSRGPGTPMGVWIITHQWIGAKPG
jgi:hypothetical protein